ncbi:phosphatase PAP2 family protein [Streptomyces sp. AC536]|uniref:phosphatase PAP2 family protein n=1 Tax=Streptomyces buecherae TaxID=2763006 RepID=UPI00164E2C55|nr:phosphatase PAP2 family protein [Streptomyces buecherae]MBC3984015.1 phosphatase PAP2 family protein [Streptomyces buecherae]QNJ42828.1 phosphatase PAP2 family protein [Streptomyces buecherae]
MGEAISRTPEGRTAALPPPIEERAEEAGPPVARTRLARLRVPRRPRLWFEILLIAVSYWTYSLIRNAVPAHKDTALRNAHWIWDAEQSLGLAVERGVNHGVDSVTWLIVGMNYYYATLHFVVTIGVLVWLYRWHPGRYAAIRLVLFATTGVALVGFFFFPLAPPRLMPDMDFIDTVLVHRTWGSLASGNLAEVSNQYAAMPSMHIGWSTWCGITIAALARPRWVKTLGVLYPVATLVVIVATANHFWLDAVGGLICLSFGFAVAALWYAASPYRLPRHIASPVARRSVPGRTAQPPAADRAAAPEAAPAPATPLASGPAETADADPAATGGPTAGRPGSATRRS